MFTAPVRRDGKNRANVEFMVKTVYIMWTVELRDEKSKAISQVPDFHSWLVRKSLAPLTDLSSFRKLSCVWDINAKKHTLFCVLSIYESGY